MTKYVLPVRVYLEDTDAQGVVYNASYFRFMERARTECLRAQGIDHDQLREEHGVVLVLASIAARFRAPARLSRSAVVIPVMPAPITATSTETSWASAG